RVLKDDDFTATAQVDRYGRKLKSGNKKKALQRLYQEEDEEGEGEDQAESGEDDDIVQRELAKADKAYDPARGGGFSSSDESDSDDEEDDEDEDGGAQVDDGSGMQRFQNEQAEVPSGEVTNRIAIVNLDWDHIKAADLMALFSSFAPAGGRIEKVSIYPSEFGKERMQREELEGPPKEIFKRAKSDDEESDDSEDDNEDEEDDESEEGDEDVKNELIKEGDDQDFDSDALRSYQLDRLRYFYAVMVCSNNATAEKIYSATDGTEYLSSSNFIDLRFIPDDVTFDDEPREECTSVPSGHKPVDFVTDALQHSKVKLTWDIHPEEASRKESMKQAFSGSRADIAENDLRAYLASDSESDGEEAIGEPEKEVSADPKLSKKELARKKMREALGLSDEPAAKASKDGPVGDMQITFTSALSDKPSKRGQDAEQEETTVEKYMRKERERKEEARKKAKAKREGLDPDALVDEEREEPKEELGFDDPFFTAEEPDKASKSALRKEERLKKRAAREAEEKEKAAEKA
ncbi:MAG: hypothetical protein OK454_05100, partial [Thaumarchaeota archaeon]|nr:hypothetical protein [Nitrososphaerota archaeon]